MSGNRGLALPREQRDHPRSVAETAERKLAYDGFVAK